MLFVRRRAAGAIVATLYLGLAGAAHANGRFPEAQAIVAPPTSRDAQRRSDPTLSQTLYLRATFGVVVSRDGGKSWRWICEQALGFEGEWDPPLTVTRDGRLWVGLADGLRSSFDGCSSEEHVALRGETIADLTVDPGGDGVIALVSTPTSPGRVVWLDARGKSIASLGALHGLRLDTVEAAPSLPKRVYITGVPTGAGPRGHLFRGERGGDLLEMHPKDVGPEVRLLVSAVDPKDPDRILVRGLSGEGSDVLLSTDGGKTMKQVLHIKSSMFGFAKSDDGTTYWAGSGDPTDGVYRSKDRGETWEPMAKVRVYCLEAHAKDLYACSTPYRPDGFAVAVSHDGGATFERLNRFDDIAGAISCEAGAGTVCDGKWPTVRSTLLPRPAPSTIADADASHEGSSPDGSASTASSGAASDAGPTPPKPRASACGCELLGVKNSTPFRGLPLLVFVALVPLARRRRGSPWTQPEHDGPQDASRISPPGRG